MTTEAIKTVIHIVCNIPVFTVHIRAIMLMAVHTGEECEIRRSGMAIPAGIPFIPVAAGIDAKMESVMIKGGWCPGSCSMAGFTLLRESG